MEKNQTTQSTQPAACSCDCTVCKMGHHRLLRIVLIILGLLIAFSLGAKFGAIRGYMYGGYDGWGRGDRFYMMRGYGAPMMQYAPTPTTQQAPAPAQPAPANQ